MPARIHWLFHSQYTLDLVWGRRGWYPRLTLDYIAPHILLMLDNLQHAHAVCTTPIPLPQGAQVSNVPSIITSVKVLTNDLPVPESVTLPNEPVNPMPSDPPGLPRVGGTKVPPAEPTVRLAGDEPSGKLPTEKAAETWLLI